MRLSKIWREGEKERRKKRKTKTKKKVPEREKRGKEGGRKERDNK